MVAGAAKSSHLKLQAENRKNELGMAGGFESSPSDVLLPARPHLLSLPNSTTNWRLSVQMHETMRDISSKLPYRHICNYMHTCIDTHVYVCLCI